MAYEEIIDAIETTAKEKAPWVDGFPIELDLPKDEIVQSVQHFFNTIITLIPKVHPQQR